MRELTAFILIFLCLQTVISKELVTRSKIFPTEIPYWWQYYKNSIYHVQFDDREPHTPITKIYFGKLDDIFNSSSLLYNCTYTFEGTQNQTRRISTIATQIFDKDKILIFLKDYSTNKYEMSGLDLSTCDVIHPNISLFMEEIFLVANSYNVYFQNETLCGKKVCKMTLDENFNLVDGPKPWYSPDCTRLQIFNIDPKDSDYGEAQLILEDCFGLGEQVSLVTEKEVKALLTPVKDTILRASISNNGISLAYVADTKVTNNETVINVHQFDSIGNLKLQLQMNFTGILDLLEIRHLADGGFLLVTTTLESYSIFVTKYDANGKVISKPLEIEGFRYMYTIAGSSGFNKMIFMYENQNEENCLIQMQPAPSGTCESKKCIRFLEKCFQEEDLEPL